jgi:hypothetical protein
MNNPNNNNQKQFLEELSSIYKYLNTQKDEQNIIFEYISNNEFDKDNCELEYINEFLKANDLEANPQSYFALATRLINLKNEPLTKLLESLNYSEDKIDKLLANGYEWSKDYHINCFKELLGYIDGDELLSPFYRAVFHGVYEVGLQITKLQPLWTKTIINETNRNLEKEFKDTKEILDHLTQNNLLEIDSRSGDIAPKSYSILIKKDDKYSSEPYAVAFEKEIKDIVKKIDEFIDNLEKIEDEIYHQKEFFVDYLNSLKIAFGQSDKSKLISNWADVDEKWMAITSPIQIGHPLEYYEDHYKKAVALEWDIRIINPAIITDRKEVAQNKFDELFDKYGLERVKNQKLYNSVINGIKQTQTYLGRPAMYFGAEFDGMFSAQVVPNDEIVSNKLGKKIFAFGDEILQIQRARPFMKLTSQIFPKEFLHEYRKYIFGDDKVWHKIYDISTIGHEFGHILWCKDSTEAKMNVSGNYKNIEEFKATAGGLMSFFDSKDEEKYWQEVLYDLITRAVGLIAYQEVGDVEPYYCEGLIHLNGLFDSGILSFEDKKLEINDTKENFEKLKNWYYKTYQELASCYIQENDANEFLLQFVNKDECFLPLQTTIKDFVEYYYNLYKQIGNEVDETANKSQYINIKK